jgi:hypothetical protein
VFTRPLPGKVYAKKCRFVDIFGRTCRLTDAQHVGGRAAAHDVVTVPAEQIVVAGVAGDPRGERVADAVV